MKCEDCGTWHMKLDNERGETRELLRRYERLLSEALHAHENNRRDVVSERLEDVLESIRKVVK